MNGGNEWSEMILSTNPRYVMSSQFHRKPVFSSAIAEGRIARSNGASTTESLQSHNPPNFFGMEANGIFNEATPNKIPRVVDRTKRFNPVRE